MDCTLVKKNPIVSVIRKNLEPRYCDPYNYDYAVLNLLMGPL